MKQIQILFKIVFTSLLVFIIYSQFWAWHRTQVHNDIINLKCKFLNVDCATEGWFYKVIEVYNSDYSHLIGSNIEIVCDENVANCDSINRYRYENSELFLTGKLYKDKSHTGIYDCDIDSYRFNTLKIIIK